MLSLLLLFLNSDKWNLLYIIFLLEPKLQLTPDFLFGGFRVAIVDFRGSAFVNDDPKSTVGPSSGSPLSFWSDCDSSI